MRTLQEEIDILKSKIEGYENDLGNAMTETRKDLLLNTITERSKVLALLLAQQQQQQQQQGGKFYIHIIHCVCIGVWCG